MYNWFILHSLFFIIIQITIDLLSTILMRNVLDTANIFIIITFSILSALVDRISRSTALQRHKYLSPLTSAFSFIAAGENIRVARASASFRRRFRDMLLGRRSDPPHTHLASCKFIYSLRWAMYDSCTVVYDTRRILCGGGSPADALCVSWLANFPPQRNHPGISQIPFLQISGCCQECSRLSVLILPKRRISRKFCTEKHKRIMYVLTTSL